MENYQTVSVALEKPVATVRINRPDALNALNSVVVRELVAALDSLERNDSVRCVVLTGSDKAFCAGADIKEMAKLSAADIEASDHLKPVWDRAASFEKPLIAALSGYALGGGLELAMCCDIIIASEGTKLGQPEINIGIIPGGGGTQRLPRAVGKHKAMEMILTGAAITAEEAKALGLVNRLVPPGKHLEEATKMAVEISAKAPLAVRAAKKAVAASQDLALSQGLEVALDMFHDLFATEDQKEGMSAFLEKRKPSFKGK
jgi:enoyl-CoA hydratase/carnithine racemase